MTLRGHFESAERHLKRAILVDPQSAESRCALASAFAAQRRPNEALSCYDNLIALKPDHVGAHLSRGDLLSQLGRFDDAIAGYDNVIALNPQHLDALTRKGEALHHLGRFMDAIACY